MYASSFRCNKNRLFRFVKYFYALTILFHPKSRNYDAVSSNSKSRIALCDTFHLIFHPFNHKNQKIKKIKVQTRNEIVGLDDNILI